ncbi:MAG: DUF4159 domain-containing protein [Verrucomicrobiota bacterium]|nr:DUF4159 domain-containing protein [Verrucomicrobiota bacterium]MDG1892923.1 DUF4159 domain-containing protein [Verrucomicrobiota bacterium]
MPYPEINPPLPYKGSFLRRNRAILPWIVTLAVIFSLSSTKAQYGRRFQQPKDERAGVPKWDIDARYQSDVFTFVRIQYNSWSDQHGRWGKKCLIDWPESDLNFAYRLEELTSLKVDSEGKIIDLTDPALFDYPFVYLIEPGEMVLREEEREALRRYLLGGGFMMIDDFWGVKEYENLRRELSRVFPDRTPEELSIDHPVFNFVFPLKEKPQIPNVGRGTDSQWDGITFERWDAQSPFYKGMFDDNGRLMMIICHNTDLGDGWEWEGANKYYFREFSEKKAYPLGINIVMYALTH